MTSFSAVEQYIEKAIETFELPGAVVAIANKEQIIYEKAFGMRYPDQKLPMENATLFDVASLTKVMATTPALLACLERGYLDLDDAVAHYIPAFERLHSDVTIKHLSTHTSGWQPFIKFYELQVDKTFAINLIAQTDKVSPAGSKVLYSDLNFILLGEIIEIVTGKTLDEFAKEIIFEPLKMENTQFVPSAELQLQTAPTEYVVEEKRTIWGEVHDENARLFKGVSGHAGLFSTAADCARYAQLYLNDGAPLFKKATIDMMAANYTGALGDARAIGWDLYNDGTFSGQYFKDGFGHTGFTGTSIWISREQGIAIVLLTNRVHYGRETLIGRFRRIVHNLVGLALQEEN